VSHGDSINYYFGPFSLTILVGRKQSYSKTLPKVKIKSASNYCRPGENDETSVRE